MQITIHPANLKIIPSLLNKGMETGDFARIEIENTVFLVFRRDHRTFEVNGVQVGKKDLKHYFVPGLTR